MRFLRYIFCALLFVTASVADTININWMDGNTTYAQTTCEIGGDIILPEPPTKRGYTFNGWLAGCARLEYIESTGTQYIDTGIKPLSNYSFKADYMFTGTTSLGYQAFFGLYTGSTKDYGVLFGPEIYVYSGKSIKKPSSVILNTKFSVHYDGINKRLTTTNGDDVDFSSLTGFSDETPVSMKLFNLTWTTGSYNYPFKGRLYYLTVYDGNSNIVANFIPAKRNSDNVVGMYDTVSNTFFTNAGTGEFIAGPVAYNQNFYE